MVSEIANATTEQARAINEITQVISAMEKVVHMNSQSSEECTATSTQLKDEAQVLASSLHELLVVVNGTT
jgi:methyl-accepting chemotaxis protein